MAQSFKLFFMTFAARVFITFCEHGATINNFFPWFIIGFSILSMDSMLLISASDTSTCTSSSIHSSFLWLFINSGDEYPLSIFKPLVVSKLVSAPWDFSTVTIPFYPHCYMCQLLFSLPPCHCSKRWSPHPAVFVCSPCEFSFLNCPPHCL